MNTGPDITEIDVFDDAVLHRFYTIIRSAELHDRPDAPVWSELELAVHLRVREESEEWHAYAAYTGQDMVGVAFLVAPLHDNTKMTWGAVGVEPRDRGQGIGSALAEFICGVTAGLGRDRVLVEARYAIDRRDDHPYRKFAEHRGFRLASTEITRVCLLPIRQQQLDAWQADAAPHHAGYDIQTYVDDVPEELLPSFCYLTNQLAIDAPTGDIEFEAETVTPQQWHVRMAKLKEQRRSVIISLGLDPSGQAVAVTVLCVPQLDPGKVYQWATLVRRDHRGHRLGLALKTANLRTLQRLHPDRTKIFTSNEETNDAMVDINERMGFTPIEILAEFQRDLSTDPVPS